MKHVRTAITLATASALALTAAACTSQQEQSVINTIETACQILPIGTVFTVTFASSVAFTAPLAPVIQTIGTAVAADCNALATAVKAVIDAINAAGGTAVVNANASTGAGAASLKKLGDTLSAKYHLKTVATSKGITFIVPPTFPNIF